MTTWPQENKKVDVMNVDIRDFVLNQPLFCNHDHHVNFKDFEKGRDGYDYRSLLEYAQSDLVTAAGARPDAFSDDHERIRSLWPAIRTTGYGRAVTLTCQGLCGMDYTPETFDAVTQTLRDALEERSPAEIYDAFVRDSANIRWDVQDGLFRPGNEALTAEIPFPDYYRFAWRMDGLFSISDFGPIETLQRACNMDILSLDDLVEAMHVNIDHYMQTERLAAFKVGIAYQRDLIVGDPTRHQAESAFSRIRNRKTFYDGMQQNAAPLNAGEARPLADYLLHSLLVRANDEDIPVQIHTGYLAGNWGSLAGTKAIHLVPLFEKYRRVRFDIFHASWPWDHELGAIAKNYPNVYPDMCWAWTMNPEAMEQALSQWLDAVPFTKIFAFGADTILPWCNVGYALQARLGIANVLEKKIAAGAFSRSTAEDVARAIMLTNGEEFFGLTE
jgi:predicted TIM-barrel fold metal-dependent hydrolase